MSHSFSWLAKYMTLFYKHRKVSAFENKELWEKYVDRLVSLQLYSRVLRSMLKANPNFKDVKAECFRIPIGHWPAGKHGSQRHFAVVDRF